MSQRKEIDCVVRLLSLSVYRVYNDKKRQCVGSCVRVRDRRIGRASCVLAYTVLSARARTPNRCTRLNFGQLLYEIRGKHGLELVNDVRNGQQEPAENLQATRMCITLTENKI